MSLGASYSFVKPIRIEELCRVIEKTFQVLSDKPDVIADAEN